MMSSRAWTTRLQNSIRNIVPSFNNELVYNVLHSAKNAEHALNFFRWVERSGLFRHDRETHFKIIQILGRAEKLNHARCILLDMPNKGVDWDEDLWVLMIDSYGKAGIVQESVKLFSKMEELGVERTVKSYNALFNVITLRGRHMMAKRYFNKMVNEGIEPTGHTYNLLIWGFFLSSKLDTAIRFFEDMKSKEIMPDVVTYNTMINGYNWVKKIEEAEKFFVEMKSRNIEPNVISYTTMIKGYSLVGRIDDALRLFEEMKGFGIKPKAITYSTLLHGLCDAKKMSEAGMILKEMEDNYIAPKDNSIFIRLISGQCEAGDLDVSADVLKTMIRLSVPTEAGHYGVLIENFCKAGKYDRASMEPSAYNLIIDYLCNNGQTGKAETLFRQLMKTGIQDPIAFNNLVCGHSREGVPDSAFELLKIIGRRKVLSDGISHKSVMESLMGDGRVQTASRVMKIMLKKGVKEHMDLISTILEALLMRGHVEEALGRIELLLDNSIAPDLDGLVAVLCEKGKTAAALKLLDFSLERNCNIAFSSYDKVLDSLGASVKTLNAYSIMCKMMEKGGVKDHKRCEKLIKSLNDEGNTKLADILRRMILGKETTLDSQKGKKRQAWLPDSCNVSIGTG
ncbi:unnamed protein product [Withania somnifera]